MSERMSDERLAEIKACDADRNRRTVRDRPNSAIAHRHELLAEVERLRTALSEFGNVRTHWGVQHPLLGTEYVQGAINAGAECLRRNAATSDQSWCLVTRLVGEWREASRG